MPTEREWVREDDSNLVEGRTQIISINNQQKTTQKLQLSDRERLSTGEQHQQDQQQEFYAHIDSNKEQQQFSAMEGEESPTSPGLSPSSTNGKRSVNIINEHCKKCTFLIRLRCRKNKC